MELYFSDEYDNESLFLMQMPENILKKIEKNENLIIKGKKPALLCTKKETFKLSGIDTTNTLSILYLIKIYSK